MFLLAFLKTLNDIEIALPIVLPRALVCASTGVYKRYLLHIQGICNIPLAAVSVSLRG